MELLKLSFAVAYYVCGNLGINLWDKRCKARKDLARFGDLVIINSLSDLFSLALHHILTKGPIQGGAGKNSELLLRLLFIPPPSRPTLLIS